MKTRRLAAARRSPSVVEPVAPAPATTPTTPANAIAAYTRSARVRRSPNMRDATSSTNAGWSAGMSVAFTIDVSWKDAKPVMTLEREADGGRERASEQHPREPAARRIGDGDRDGDREQDPEHHDRRYGRVDAPDEERPEAPREHRRRRREQRQRCAAATRRHPGTLCQARAIDGWDSSRLRCQDPCRQQPTTRSRGAR